MGDLEFKHFSKEPIGILRVFLRAYRSVEVLGRHVIKYMVPCLVCLVE